MLLPVQLRKRKSDTHKGDYGHVLVVGGSSGLTGAVCLCANSALRSGAGLVTAAVAKSLHDIIEIKLTEVMSLALAETKDRSLSLSSFKDIKEKTKKIDVLTIGCGASQNLSTQKLICRIVKEINLPMVVDADGLNALAKQKAVLKSRKSKNIVLTPHLGEFSRLIGETVNNIKKRRKELAKEFALRYNLILVLKANSTIVTDGKKIFENKTANPGMATAGSGDVLSGIISGLIAQGINIFDAAKFGVYIHGKAGNMAAKEISQTCLIASDIIEYLPNVILSD